MNKLLLTALLLTLGFRTFAQAQGFLSFYEDEDFTSWETYDAIETECGDYLIAVNDWDIPQWKSKILKLSGNGDFCEEMVLEATDTTMCLGQMFASRHNPKIFVGFALCNHLTEAPTLMTIQFDEDLNVIHRKVVAMPSFGDRVSDIKFLSLENEYIAAATYREMLGIDFVLYKISENGDILQFATCEADSLSYISNLFNIHNRPDCFGMYICATNSSNASTGVILFDETLQIYKRTFYGSWITEEYGNHQCLSYLQGYNGMCTPIPDGNYLISSRINESLIVQPFEDDQSAIFVKADTNFMLMPNRQVIGHLNDTMEQPAYFKSVGCTSDAIYQCSLQNVYPELWPWQHSGLNLVVTKTDFELNIIWQKRLLTDGNVYSPYNLIATSDGGCLITGTRFDQNTDRHLDVFALKLDAEGLCSTFELETVDAVSVYPNPTFGRFTISADDLKCVEVYNAVGQIVAKRQSENKTDISIDLNGLPAGIYSVKVSDMFGKTSVRKVVKE